MIIKVKKMNSDDKFWAIFWVTIACFTALMFILFGGEPDIQDAIIKALLK